MIHNVFSNFCSVMLIAFLLLSTITPAIAESKKTETSEKAETKKTESSTKTGDSKKKSSWPPAYKELRFEVDWTPPDWKVVDKKSQDFTDRLKVVRLSNNGDYYVGFGGQLRARYLNLTNPTFNDVGLGTLGLWTLRSRLYADFHLTSHTQVYLEGILSSSTLDDNEFIRLGQDAPNKNGDFLNAFVEFRTTPMKKYNDWDLGFWLGRREIAVGKLRMISSQSWMFSRRSYEGLGFLAIGKNNSRIDGWIVNPVVVVPDAFNTREKDTILWLLKYTAIDSSKPAYMDGKPIMRLVAAKVNWSAYLLGGKRKNIEYVQGRADDNRITIGVLSYGPIGATTFDYEFEAMFQNGTFGNADISAYNITAQLGYTIPNFMIPSRVWGSFDWASGDTNPNDNKLGTFEPYFPASLAFFGIHALLERKNIQTLNLNMDMLLHKNFSIRASTWKLTRAETSDGMYNTWGGISRFPGGSTNRDLGEVYQIVGSFKMSRHLSLVAGYSYWAAGGFQRETQTTEVKDVNMFALTMSLDF